LERTETILGGNRPLAVAELKEVRIMEILTKDELWRCFLKDCDVTQHETLEDMPVPATDWRQIAACVLFVALVAIVMVAMLWAL